MAGGTIEPRPEIDAEAAASQDAVAKLSQCLDAFELRAKRIESAIVRLEASMGRPGQPSRSDRELPSRKVQKSPPEKPASPGSAVERTQWRAVSCAAKEEGGFGRRDLAWDTKWHDHKVAHLRSQQDGATLHDSTEDQETEASADTESEGGCPAAEKSDEIQPRRLRKCGKEAVDLTPESGLCEGDSKTPLDRARTRRGRVATARETACGEERALSAAGLLGDVPTDKGQDTDYEYTEVSLRSDLAANIDGEHDACTLEATRHREAAQGEQDEQKGVRGGRPAKFLHDGPADTSQERYCADTERYRSDISTKSDEENDASAQEAPQRCQAQGEQDETEDSSNEVQQELKAASCGTRRHEERGRHCRLAHALRASLNMEVRPLTPRVTVARAGGGWQCSARCVNCKRRLPLESNMLETEASQKLKGIVCTTCIKAARSDAGHSERVRLNVLQWSQRGCPQRGY